MSFRDFYGIASPIADASWRESFTAFCKLCAINQSFYAFCCR